MLLAILLVGAVVLGLAFWAASESDPTPRFVPPEPKPLLIPSGYPAGFRSVVPTASTSAEVVARSETFRVSARRCVDLAPTQASEETIASFRASCARFAEEYVDVLEDTSEA